MRSRPDRLRTMSHRLPLLVLSSLAAPALAQGADKQKVDFEKQVWPILEKNCIECHAAEHVENGRAKKPKGKVELDSKDGIATGKRGKLVVAGRVDDSLLVEVISLDADDEDRMPPPKKGPPLAKEHIELIRRWIDQGAEFGKWTGAPKARSDDKGDGPDDGGDAKGGDARGKDAKGKPKGDGDRKSGKQKGESPLVALQKGLQPVAAATLASFAGGPFQVQSVGDDSPLLRVACFGNTDDVDDRAIAALAPLADHVTELDLGRSHVTDAACEQLAKFRRLTRLDLRQTQVSNQGVAALAALKELRTLNLFATKTGDYALAALAGLPHLEQLYLWQTEVTPQAIVRLRETLPDLRVVFTADLPEPMADQPADGRRRR